MENRIKSIDEFRGFAIILMLLQHIPLFLANDLNNITYTIAVLLSRFSAPIFFVIAGYCTYLSFNKNGPKHILKRAIEIFIYSIPINIFRHNSLLTINVLTSISAFIVACTILIYIRSKYAYALALIALIAYSFMSPEIISNDSIQHPLDILNAGEYPIAPWLIYAITGTIIAVFKPKQHTIILSCLSIIFGSLLFLLNVYDFSFIQNTPPFLFIISGLIGILYKLPKPFFLSTFGENALFIYVSHMFLFSFIPVVTNLGNTLNIHITLIIYIITLGIAYYLLYED